jgi:hypothetical protein
MPFVGGAAAMGRIRPFVRPARLERPNFGEETFFIGLRSDGSLEIEAPLGDFPVDKILRWASLYRQVSSPRPMT